MQIQYIKTDGFKALKNFEIEFEQQEQGDSLAVIVGENGVGKSSLLEAILRIFGSFYSPKIAKQYRFDFEIRYIHAIKQVNIICVNQVYTVKVLEDKKIIFEKTGSPRTINKNLNKMDLRIFPMRLVTFYSGTNDNLKDIVKVLESSYKNSWRTDVISNLQLIYSENPIERELNESYTRYDKKFIHCQENLVPIYLISLLLGTDSSNKEFLKSELNISDDMRIMLELNLKYWKILTDKVHGSIDDKELIFNKIIDIFSFVLDGFEGKEEFMDAIYHGTNKTIIDKKCIVNITASNLLKLPQSAIYNFLERVTALFDAKIQVRTNGINIMEFSEGQLQLIKIFGMLSICKNEECLVLLDEPDAHMNPKWKYGIKDYIGRAVSGAINTQIIVASHDPLVINGLAKEDIRIMNKDENGNIKSYYPIDDTMGMGIDGLLQSEYYGLKTSYDKNTSDKYQERQQLYIKLINQEITDAEKIKLRSLTREIGALPVANNTIDFLYDDFIQIYKKSKYYLEDYLSPNEIKERNEYMERVIEELFEEEK